VSGHAGHGTLLTGWGRTAPSRADVLTPRSEDEVVSLVTTLRPRGLVARGLGRSYGDAAQNAGGAVIDMTELKGITDFDEQAGRIRALAGTSLAEIIPAALARGWFLPVSPGTRHVTVGGAIASDIHGKNHHVEGTFGSHVTSLSLACPSKGRIELSPDGKPAPFWATVGGMGLTGVILEAEFDLIPAASSEVLVDTDRAEDLDSLMALLAAEAGHRYSVAWVDCLATGRHLGRGLSLRGDHAPEPAASEPVRAYSPPRSIEVPPIVPGGLLNRWTVRAFNEAYFRAAPMKERGKRASVTSFFHPLDAIGGWNNAYGPRGFIQYQCVVPTGAETSIRWILETLAAEKQPTFLAVLKRFGPRNPGPLSFPIEGWTLAFDCPAGSPGLRQVLDRLDERVAEVGGRVYLTKDARLRPEMLEAMYPELTEWRAVRAELDPDGALGSDLSHRLSL